jgi:glutamine phosphoribosylpyrophosphate amidotransferase
MKIHDLLEDISIDGDSLRITVQHYKSASTPESISTGFRTQPYSTAIKGCDAEVFSLLNYVSSDTSTQILKSLKGHGPYKVNDKQFEAFMKQVKTAASKVVSRVNPDIIIYPKSKSDFLKRFVNEVKSGSSIEVLDDQFIKSVLDAENVEPLINTNHPDWKKFSTDHPKEVDKLKKQLKTHVAAGELELKKLYKPYLKFIKNFIELKDAYEVLDKVLGKRVLVIDDILSSGATMAEMIRQLNDFEPSKIAGLTIFKHTTLSKTI